MPPSNKLRMTLDLLFHYLLGVCHILCERKSEHPTRTEPIQRPSLEKKCQKSQLSSMNTVYDAWLASRVIPRREGTYLLPGSQRPFNIENARLALIISKQCAFDLFIVLFRLNPARTTLMMCLNIIRSLSPAFRGYWQALALNELQSLIASGNFTWVYLLRLIATEILRRFLESLMDSFANSNDTFVHNSARFFVEYQQMERRVRLDLPTLADPVVRDLLQESEIFARSFNGMGGFGLLSPFDLIHILSLCIEVVSHIWVVLSLTGGTTHFGVLLFSILTAVLPLLMSWFGIYQQPAESLYTSREARAAERQERMRNLAYSDSHRPEILLFGLGPWILNTWATAHKIVLGAEQPTLFRECDLSLSLLLNLNLSDFMFALQNIPLVLMMQSSSTSLGALTLYRGSIQSVVAAVGNLVTTVKMAFQGIFLMGAFYAAMKIQPRLQPKEDDVLDYKSVHRGATIEVRNLSYTYPGNTHPSLKNVNLKLEAGEVLAIVGYNGSGKSTFAQILLRMLEFDEGDLLINGVDIRRLDPAEYHSHIMAVLQSFSKYSTTVKENVGIGFVKNLGSPKVIEKAVRLAGANNIVDSLPSGLRTKLDTSGFDSTAYPPFPDASKNQVRAHMHHGLSGGEWQRIALSRAFMRAGQPEIDILLFDEPTSSLDAHAQNNIFDTIEEISRSPTGDRTMTVIFITHRLSVARRADKIAMMDNGVISEFGSHEDLLRADGPYAALYRASV